MERVEPGPIIGKSGRMKDCNFTSVVVVEPPDSRRVCIVTDAVYAAEILLRHWPAEHWGPKHRLAMWACVEALRGKRQIKVAQRTFIAAAVQARMLKACEFDIEPDSPCG